MTDVSAGVDQHVGCRPPDLEQYVYAGPQRIFVAQWNPDAPRVVVLLHGLGVQSFTWAPIATALAAGHRVVTFDFRGHGRSDWAPGGYPLRSFVDDTLHVLTHYGLHDVVLVGHSLGTRVAIGAAGRMPRRVRGIFLSDGGPVIPDETSRTLKDIEQTRPRSYESAEEAASALADLYPSWTEQFRELHVQHQFRQNWMGKLVTRTDPEIRWVYHEDYWSQYEELWDDLAAVDCPVRLLLPSTSRHVAPETVERMNHVVADFDVVQVEGGHFYPRERPVDFIGHLDAFLETLDQRRSARMEATR